MPADPFGTNRPTPGAVTRNPDDRGHDDARLRLIWDARNTDGITLSEAVAAVRAGMSIPEGTDAPAS